VAEFPVTAFMDGFGKPRPMHITACSASELERGLVAVSRRGLPAATLVSHNFELLTKGLKKEARVVVRRFDRLCAWLARHRDEFPVGSFNPELAAEKVKPWVLPRVSPLATTIRYGEQFLRRVRT